MAASRRAAGDLAAIIDFMFPLERLLPPSLARFEQEFGYELRDPFEDICSMLKRGRAFAFSRFGDGEFNAVFGVEGANCDGHEYFPDLGQRLRSIVQSQPDYMVGMMPAVVFRRGAAIRSLAPEMRWVLSDGLHLASRAGRLSAFFVPLKHRDVELVGPAHLRPLTRAAGWRHHVIPARNCWTFYEEVIDRLRSSLPGPGSVTLFCASMMSNVLIDDLYQLEPEGSYIDAGSLFDPYVGLKSRLYHNGLDTSALKIV